MPVPRCGKPRTRTTALISYTKTRDVTLIMNPASEDFRVTSHYIGMAFVEITGLTWHSCLYACSRDQWLARQAAATLIGRDVTVPLHFIAEICLAAGRLART